MKAIMISIQPQWTERILNGEKTIEIRKTRPKCELPCKVYIYCTKGKEEQYTPPLSDTNYEHAFGYVMNGKVVAEFTLNKVKEYGYIYSPLLLMQGYYTKRGKELDYSKCCLKLHEIEKYADDGEILPKPIYAWHIDDLKIYDEPKELGEFYDAKECPYKDWGDIDNLGCWETGCEMFSRGECRFGHLKLDRPPQSWCYVEEMK